MSLIAAAFAATLVFGPAPASAQDPLSYENYVTCAAIFLRTANDTEDAELKEALEGGVGVMLRRAVPIAARRGLDQEAVIEAASRESLRLDEAVAGLTGDARTDRVRSFGPGLEVCLDEVLTDR